MAELTPWVVVAGMAGVAFIFYFRALAAEARAEKLRGVSEKLQGDLEEARVRL